MRQDGYKITSCILHELNLAKTVKQTGLGIGRNLKRDPVSLGIAVSPIPGSFPTGIGLHIAKSKGSQKRLRVLGRKLVHPSKWNKQRIN